MAFEHRDITPEKRPEHPGPTTRERSKTFLFFDLMKETLTDFEEARQKKPEGKDKPLQNAEFFFKKSWDRFSEPLLEYDNLLQEIETKQWESKGAKSRAKNALQARRTKSIAGAKEILPEFETMDAKKQKQALARIYEGYASYIQERRGRLEGLAGEVEKGFDQDLRGVLGVWGPRPEAGKEGH